MPSYESRVELAGGVLAERAQAAGDPEALDAQTPRLATRDPEAPHGAGAVVADEVAAPLRGPRLAAIDMATGDGAALVAPVLEDGKHELPGACGLLLEAP